MPARFGLRRIRGATGRRTDPASHLLNNLRTGNPTKNFRFGKVASPGQAACFVTTGRTFELSPNSFVPDGTWGGPKATRHPPINRWAIFFRPTGWKPQFHRKQEEAEGSGFKNFGSSGSAHLFPC